MHTATFVLGYATLMAERHNRYINTWKQNTLRKTLLISNHPHTMHMQALRPATSDDQLVANLTSPCVDPKLLKAAHTSHAPHALVLPLSE